MSTSTYIPSVRSIRNAVATGRLDLSRRRRWRGLRLDTQRLTWARNRTVGWKVNLYAEDGWVGEFTIESHEIQ